MCFVGGHLPPGTHTDRFIDRQGGLSSRRIDNPTTTNLSLASMLIELVDLLQRLHMLYFSLANMQKVQQRISIYFIFKLIYLLQEPANTELSMLLAPMFFQLIIVGNHQLESIIKKNEAIKMDVIWGL